MNNDLQYNMDLANRQIEVNEWSYNNKMDTLFVFQVIFLAILFCSILFILKGQGMVGAAFVWYSVTIVSFIVVAIIVNRIYYTAAYRDKRFWNRRVFEGDNTTEGGLRKTDPAAYARYVALVESTFGPKPAGAGGASGACVCPGQTRS